MFLALVVLGRRVYSLFTDFARTVEA